MNQWCGVSVGIPPIDPTWMRYSNDLTTNFVGVRSARPTAIVCLSEMVDWVVSAKLPSHPCPSGAAEAQNSPNAQILDDGLVERPA